MRLPTGSPHLGLRGMSYSTSQSGERPSLRQKKVGSGLPSEDTAGRSHGSKPNRCAKVIRTTQFQLQPSAPALQRLGDMTHARDNLTQYARSQERRLLELPTVTPQVTE